MKITLDAGHYGKYNRSPVVPEYYESERMWKLHLMLAKALESRGFEVVLTRQDADKDLEVTKRGKVAAGSDLFISLHSDYADNADVNRVSVFRAYDNKNNASVFSNLIGKAVADAMGIAVYADKTRTLNTGGGEYYGVLRGARAAGCPLYCIVEHGFHTNAYTALWLMDDKNLEKLAQAEAKAVSEHFGVSLPIALTQNFRLFGILPETSVAEAKKTLALAGYDAAIYKDDREKLCTSDSVYIGSEVYSAVIRGDGNGDGSVTSADYLLAKRAALGSFVPTGAFFDALDMNGDGKITAADYLLIKRSVLGK